MITFRILFGLMMAFGTARFIFLGWIDDHYVRPAFHFKYFGFEWVEALPAPAMYGLHALMLLAALGIALGAWYRLSAATFFLTFTYTELIDLTYYLNHYYFVSLVALLLIFLPAQRRCSVDAWRRGSPGGPQHEAAAIPAWPVWLLKFQIFIVYFYAGLAKINSDWLLEALPLRIWLPAHDGLPLIGPLMHFPATAYVFSWAGMLFDTTVIFFLMWGRTRVAAYIAIVVFHTITGLMFQIGIFPLVMMAGTVIFFSNQFHEKVVSWLETRLGKRTRPVVAAPGMRVADSGAAALRPVWKVLLAGYLLFQIVFPWRHLFYPGNLFWTEEGYRYSWRVMLMEKAGTATFYVRDGQTGREGMVFNCDFLNAHQEKQMAMQPDLILQFAHHLRDHYARRGMAEPMVRAEVYVTLNGRPSRLYFDPRADLTRIEDSWRPRSWLYGDPAEPPGQADPLSLR